MLTFTAVAELRAVHQIKKVMKFPSLVLLLMIACLSLRAQDVSHEVSANVLTQLLHYEFEFDPALVERVRKAQIAELIDANELLLPPVKEQIKWELGIGRETQNWRGAVARFQAECDEITVIIISVIEDETESGAVTIFIPPNNACAPLLESTLEIVYGGYVTGAEEIKRCEKYTCVNVSPYLEEEIVGCAKTIYLVDTTFPCPDAAACPEVENCEEIEEGYIIDVVIPH